MKRILGIKGLVTASIFSATFLFWWQIHPEALSWQEQNQCLLLSSSYLLQRISHMGGLADYMGEWLTQFYYYPALGATLIALLMSGIQACVRHIIAGRIIALTSSVALPLMLTALMGDPDILLAYPIATFLSLFIYIYVKQLACCWQCLLQAALCYAVGPLAIIFAALSLMQSYRKAATLAIVAILSLWMGHQCIDSTYPSFTTWYGISYYRLILKTQTVPALYRIIPIAIAFLCIVSRIMRQNVALSRRRPVWLLPVLPAITSCIGAWGVYQSYETNTYAVLEQCYLIRSNQWQQLLSRAEQLQSEGLPVMQTEVSCSAVNLALAISGQLESDFEHYIQCGPDGLLHPTPHDNVTGIATMEALFRIGLIRQAERYAFEMQESLASQRKSARFMRRIAECLIIEGRYAVARKYLVLLQQTIFYQSWAKEAMNYVNHPETIDQHPTWSHLRRCQYEDAQQNAEFFQHPAIPYYLQQLYRHYPQNALAKSYLMAYMRYIVPQEHDP